MPNKRDENKRVFHFWITAELYAKLEKLAQTLGVSMSFILTACVLEKTKNIILTPEDYERIANYLRNRKGNRL